MCGGPDKPKQTREERELGRIAVERWNDYQTRFVPVENEYIESVQQTGADFDDARGGATASVQQSFGAAEDDLRGNLFAAGLSPDSSQFTSAIEGLGLDRALSLGTAANEAEVATQNRHLTGLQNVVQMGQGQAMNAIQGKGEIAGRATQDSIDRANRSFENRQAGLHLAGTVAGAGTQALATRPTPGGTSTAPGSMARTYYNHQAGKGGY